MDSIANAVWDENLTQDRLSDPLVDVFHRVGIFIEEEIQAWIRKEIRRNTPNVAFRFHSESVYACDDGQMRPLRDAAVFQMHLDAQGL